MKLSDERSVERDELCETFADLLFSVEVTMGTVQCTLGVARIDHRHKTPIRSEVPVARLVLTHKLTKELARALTAAVEAREKIKGEDDRAALTFAKRVTN
jgi:hypothetical protein